MFGNWLDLFAYVQQVPGVSQLEHEGKNAVEAWLRIQLADRLKLGVTTDLVIALIDEKLGQLGVK